MSNLDKLPEMDYPAWENELESLDQLLSKDKEISEKDLHELLKQSPQIVKGLFDTYGSKPKADSFKHELSIAGEVRTDIVVGSQAEAAFLCVELEDASKNSIFVDSTRSLLNWGNRLEKGFSQLVDWAWKLADLYGTDALANIFGSSTIEYRFLLIIGRDHFLTDSSKKRLRWRSHNVSTGGTEINIITFDQVLSEQRVKIQELFNASAGI